MNEWVAPKSYSTFKFFPLIKHVPWIGSWFSATSAPVMVYTLPVVVGLVLVVAGLKCGFCCPHSENRWLGFPHLKQIGPLRWQSFAEWPCPHLKHLIWSYIGLLEFLDED